MNESWPLLRVALVVALAIEIVMLPFVLIVAGDVGERPCPLVVSGDAGVLHTDYQTDGCADVGEVIAVGWLATVVTFAAGVPVALRRRGRRLVRGDRRSTRALIVVLVGGAAIVTQSVVGWAAGGIGPDATYVAGWTVVLAGVLSRLLLNPVGVVALVLMMGAPPAEAAPADAAVLELATP